MTRAVAAGLLLGAALAAGGCSTVTDVMFAPRLRECRGFDMPLTVFQGTSHKELRVRVRARRVDHDMPFVVETGPESLVLIGFTPLGTKAFTLVRNGNDVEVDNVVGPGLPVPPRNIMEDVLAMSVPSPCAESPDGTATVPVGTWDVRDECHDRRPVRRSLVRVGRREALAADEAAAVVQEATAGAETKDARPAAPAPPEDFPDPTPPALAAVAAPAPEAAPAGDAEAAAEGGEDDPLSQELPDGEAEVEVRYTGNAIVVQQNRCRYRARYILQATVLAEDGADGVSDEDEE